MIHKEDQDVYPSAKDSIDLTLSPSVDTTSPPVGVKSKKDRRSLPEVNVKKCRSPTQSQPSPLSPTVWGVNHNKAARFKLIDFTEEFPPQKRAKGRVCETCRLKKIRCDADGQTPCTRCKTYGIECSRCPSPVTSVVPNKAAKPTDVLVAHPNSVHTNLTFQSTNSPSPPFFSSNSNTFSTTFDPSGIDTKTLERIVGSLTKANLCSLVLGFAKQYPTIAESICCQHAQQSPISPPLHDDLISHIRTSMSTLPLLEGTKRHCYWTPTYKLPEAIKETLDRLIEECTRSDQEPIVSLEGLVNIAEYIMHTNQVVHNFLMGRSIPLQSPTIGDESPTCNEGMTSRTDIKLEGDEHQRNHQESDREATSPHQNVGAGSSTSAFDGPPSPSRLMPRSSSVPISWREATPPSRWMCDLTKLMAQICCRCESAKVKDFAMGQGLLERLDKLGLCDESRNGENRFLMVSQTWRAMLMGPS